MLNHETLQACMDFAVTRYDRIHSEDPSAPPLEVWRRVHQRLFKYMDEKDVPVNERENHIEAARTALKHHTGHDFPISI